MRRFEPLIERGLFLCALVSVGTTVGIIAVVAVETVAFLREVPITEFLFGTEWSPLFATPSFGVLPLVAGTALVSLIAMLVALPMGLLSAIYLSEYANSRLRRILKPILELLAGVPTVGALVSAICAESARLAAGFQGRAAKPEMLWAAEFRVKASTTRRLVTGRSFILR